MNRKLLLFAALATFPSGAVPRTAASGDPPYVRYQLAGGDIRQESRGAHDVKAGYILVYTGDCDGASIDLALTADRYPAGLSQETKERWNWMNIYDDIPTGRLPRLRTGSGVNIGDSPATVQRKLKTAPQRIRMDGPLSTWMYNAVVTLGSGKGRYTKNYGAQYVFYRKKLWGIYYNLGRHEGC